MNEVILPEIRFALLPTIYLNTIRSYLNELGYVYIKVKKRIYMNRHEREDVVVYWKIFLEQMNQLEDRIPIFSGDNLEK